MHGLGAEQRPAYPLQLLRVVNVARTCVKPAPQPHTTQLYMTVWQAQSLCGKFVQRDSWLHMRCRAAKLRLQPTGSIARTGARDAVGSLVSLGLLAHHICHLLALLLAAQVRAELRTQAAGRGAWGGQHACS